MRQEMAEQPTRFEGSPARDAQQAVVEAQVVCGQQEDRLEVVA